MGCLFSKSQDPTLTSFRRTKSYVANKKSSNGWTNSSRKPDYKRQDAVDSFIKDKHRFRVTSFPGPAEKLTSSQSTETSTTTLDCTTSDKHCWLRSNVQLAENLEPAVPVSEEINNYPNDSVENNNYATDHRLKKTHKSRSHDKSIEQLNADDMDSYDKARQDTSPENTLGDIRPGHHTKTSIQSDTITGRSETPFPTHSSGNAGPRLVRHDVAKGVVITEITSDESEIENISVEDNSSTLLTEVPTSPKEQNRQIDAQIDKNDFVNIQKSDETRTVKPVDGKNVVPNEVKELSSECSHGVKELSYGKSEEFEKSNQEPDSDNDKRDNYQESVKTTTGLAPLAGATQESNMTSDNYVPSIADVPKTLHERDLKISRKRKREPPRDQKDGNRKHVNTFDGFLKGNLSAKPHGRPGSGTSTWTLDSRQSPVGNDAREQSPDLTWAVNQQYSYLVPGSTPISFKTEATEMLDVEDFEDKVDQCSVTERNTSKTEDFDAWLGVKPYSTVSSSSINDSDALNHSLPVYNIGPSSSVLNTKQKLLYARHARRPQSDTYLGASSKPPLHPGVRLKQRPASDTRQKSQLFSRYFSTNKDVNW